MDTQKLRKKIIRISALSLFLTLIFTWLGQSGYWVSTQTASAKLNLPSYLGLPWLNLLSTLFAPLAVIAVSKWEYKTGFYAILTAWAILTAGLTAIFGLLLGLVMMLFLTVGISIVVSIIALASILPFPEKLKTAAQKVGRFFWPA